ncbi:MAG: phosphatase PAP2 family protein [Candidatus Bathyarchaeota archaeon]|nr:phosphatase PAP2 family protein [Candidatus Termiticorpusculum sp.]
MKHTSTYHKTPTKVSTQLYKWSKAILVCVTFFVVFTLFSIFKTNFQSLDTTVNLWVISLHNDTAIFSAKILSAAFDTTILVIATLIISVFLFIIKRKGQSLLFVATVSGAALFVTIIKNFTQVARPENHVILASGFSYPSGHSASVVVFIGLIVYFVWLNWSDSQRVKTFSALSFGLVVAFVCFSRIYLNVHWLSDVVGGCLFGVFWLSFCIIVYEHLKNRVVFSSAKIHF